MTPPPYRRPDGQQRHEPAVYAGPPLKPQGEPHPAALVRRYAPGAAATALPWIQPRDRISTGERVLSPLTAAIRDLLLTSDGPMSAGAIGAAIGHDPSNVIRCANRAFKIFGTMKTINPGSRRPARVIWLRASQREKRDG